MIISVGYRVYSVQGGSINKQTRILASIYQGVSLDDERFKKGQFNDRTCPTFFVRRACYS